MSQRDRLLGRRIPPTPVAIRVDFSPEADAAYAEHESALRDLETAESRGADLAAAKARVEQAAAALAPHQEVLHVAPIPPSQYDELVGEHPPTDEQRARNYQWNPDTFGPALLAACIGQDLPPDERMSEKDWIDWAASGASGHAEYVLLVNTALEVNSRTVSIHVGKG
ncbi:MAG TPA: hypothetical protein VK045_02515 [Ornithinicoccus sp.]|nr:hypothetical protein [Ornithinicoccus sp.]